MYEQDVVSRMLRDAVRVLMKVLFGKEKEKTEESESQDDANGPTVTAALALADAGRLTEAENLLSDEANADAQSAFREAMLFYGYVNEFEDEFLARDGWTRARIREGICRAADRCGMRALVDALLP